MLRDLSVVTGNILVIRIGENYVGCFQNSYSEPYKRAPVKKWCKKHSHRTMIRAQTFVGKLYRNVFNIFSKDYLCMTQLLFLYY